MEYIRTNLDKVLAIEGIYTIHYYEYTKDFSYSGEFHDFWEIVYADKKGVMITAGATELTLEALAVQSRYGALFTDDEVNHCYDVLCQTDHFTKRP